MAANFSPWDVQDQLKTPEDCASFVEAVIVEAGDDTAFIVKSLGEVARSKGMAAVARNAEVSREGLYKAMSEKGSPSFATVFRLIRALGLELSVGPATT